MHTCRKATSTRPESCDDRKTLASRSLGTPARWRAVTGPARHDDPITALRHRAAFISPRSASGVLRQGRYPTLKLRRNMMHRVMRHNASPKRGQVQRQPATHPAGAVGSRTPAARWPPPCSRLSEKVSLSMLCAGKAGARIEREQLRPRQQATRQPLRV